MRILILGCGYTGRRVALRLREQGHEVLATTREAGRLADLDRLGVHVATHEAGTPLEIPQGSLVLHSIPPLEGRDPLAPLKERPARIVYLSSTGVYGRQPSVDETTQPAPATERQRARLAAEQRAVQGPWTCAILRCAAIYGPGRGVHESIRAGRYRLAGDGSNVTSRIHVEDLADLAAAALLSNLEGAWPVADDGPAPAREVAAFCAARLGLALPPCVDESAAPETLRFTRRVDGRAVRRRLGLTLRYPTYREGIPAALAQDA